MDKETIKSLIITGKIKSFPEIFRKFSYPKKLILKDTSLSGTRLELLIVQPWKTKGFEIFMIAKHFDIDPKLILDLIAITFSD